MRVHLEINADATFNPPVLALHLQLCAEGAVAINCVADPCEAISSVWKASDANVSIASRQLRVNCCLCTAQSWTPFLHHHIATANSGTIPRQLSYMKRHVVETLGDSVNRGTSNSTLENLK
ncbi:hypothetical protein ECG_09787 [Echinococcus granulosus]|nr:hypothetical protein ECG_09787 [Echinococcus granulosus]